MLELFISFIALSFLEIILGIDNIIFISLVANKVKENIRNRVRLFGLLLSLVLRLVMLFFITLLLTLTVPLFTIFNLEISWKNIFFIVGGLFLVIKGVLSIYEEVFLPHKRVYAHKDLVVLGVFSAIVQIVIVDLVFSFDSLITAVGLSDNYFIISCAITTSIIFMLLFARQVGFFIDNYPGLKVLAISFIIFIGISLVLEGLSIHIEKGFIYAAMFFSLSVEVLNTIMRKKIKNLNISIQSKEVHNDNK